MAVSPITIGIKDQAGTTQNMVVFDDAGTNRTPAFCLDSPAATYRASASFTPQATAGVTVITVTGSATKTVRIKRVMVGGVATALADTLFALQRTSALGAGGTLVAPTVAKLDSGSAAQTAVVNHWTTSLKAAGTPAGGALTTLRVFQETTGVPTVASREATMLFPERGAPIGQAIVLRGTSDFLEVQNINAGNLATGTVLDYTIEWVEDDS